MVFLAIRRGTVSAKQQMVTTKRYFSISAVSLALVALVGLTGIATSGLPARFPGFKLTQIEVGDWKQQTCFVVSTGTLASWTERIAGVRAASALQSFSGR